MSLKEIERPPARVSVLGVPVTAINMQECLSYLARNKGKYNGEYICVSNAHTTVMAHDDADYYIVQRDSLMSLPDGKPLSIVGRKSFPLMDRVTGPDLMRNIFSDGRFSECSHFFYGSTQENLDALVAELRNTYPNLKIAGFEPSLFRDLTNQEREGLIDRINASYADFVWVALGAPRQEIFCHAMRGQVKGLMVGVGGAFNILAKLTPEAPKLMKDLCLEWLYRLAQEPSRLFGRYLKTNTLFTYYLLANKPPKHLKSGKGIE